MDAPYSRRISPHARPQIAGLAGHVLPRFPQSRRPIGRRPGARDFPVAPRIFVLTSE